jgi:ribonuclease R
MNIFDRESYTDQQRTLLNSKLADYCEKSSKNEVIAQHTEFDVDALFFAIYMSKHIGEEFNGFITSVNSFGVFVQLENLIEGIIKLINFKNDFYTYNEENKTLVGKNTHKIFTLGTKVKVKALTANKQTRKIEFELA